MFTNLIRRITKTAVCAAVLAVLLCNASSAEAASSSEIKTGQEYYITSVKYSGRAINMYVDSISQIKNKTAVNLYKLDKSATQRFTFTKNSSGNFLMIPTGSKYTVNVSALKAGTAVFAWQNKAANNEYFIIEKTSDGYFTLRMQNAPSLYLTADSSTKLTLRKKASDNSQKFAFHVYPEPNTGTEKTSVTLSVKCLRQYDKRWKNISYDPKDKNATLGKYGCLVTSMCMVSNYLHNTSYTPPQYAKAKLKFDGHGYANGGEYLKLYKDKSYNSKNVKKYLDQGKPVILFGKTATGNTHYVVAYGYTNSASAAKYVKVYDPGSAKVKTMRQFLDKFKYGHCLWIMKK